MSNTNKIIDTYNTSVTSELLYDLISPPNITGAHIQVVVLDDSGTITSMTANLSDGQAIADGDKQWEVTVMSRDAEQQNISDGAQSSDNKVMNVFDDYVTGMQELVDALIPNTGEFEEHDVDPHESTSDQPTNDTGFWS